MTRYWLTVHWPHPVIPAEDHPWDVYLQDRYKDKGAHLSVGDKVLFYETAKRKAQVKTGAGGTHRVVELKPGRRGVVCAAEVAAPLGRRPVEQAQAEYHDGTHLNWAWQARCSKHETGAVVPLEDVLHTIGRGGIRVPGGLLEISSAQFDDLKSRLIFGHAREQARSP